MREPRLTVLTFKKSVLIVCALCLCGAIGLLAAAGTFLRPSGGDSEMTIVLDPGHGGIDGGTEGVTTKVPESELNLLIARELRSVLQAYGFSVIMTRENGDGLYGEPTEGFKRRDMEKRRDIVQSAAPVLMISLHLNKFSSRQREGAQVFFREDSPQGEQAARCIQDCLNQLNSRSFEALKGDYYMLNCTDFTSVIVECGFLSNPDDEKRLLTQTYRHQLAEKIAEGAVRYLWESGEIGPDTAPELGTEEFPAP